VATGDGNDTLSGIEGIDGSSGSDTFRGDSADNFFVGEGGNDQIVGGGHVNGDAAFYLFAPGPVNVSLAAGTSSGADGSDTLTNIQSLAGSDFNDTLIGNSQNNVILGQGGDDTLDGRAGFDTLDGGPGTDRCLNGENLLNCEATSSPTRSLDATIARTSALVIQLRGLIGGLSLMRSSTAAHGGANK
jgi:Ca2+-binding RTX toxin-like protein